MSKSTKIKIILGIVGSIFALLIIILLVNIGKFIDGNYDNNTYNEQELSNKQAKDNKLNMDDDFVKIIRTTAERNSDWSKLPLSKAFKKRFNNKHGILGVDDNYTYLSSNSYDSNKLENIVVLNVDHEYKQEYYYIHYTVNENNELDDVEIVGKKLLYDENGNEVIYKETMDGAFVSNIVLLAAPARLEYDPFNYIYVTDNYLKKWSAGFIDYNISCGVEDISGLEDKEQRLVYLYVVQDKFDENGTIIGDEWEKYFKVHYFVDKNMWIDDVEVEEVSKEEIDRLLSEKAKN